MFGSHVQLKTDDQIRAMRRAGLVTRAALEAARAVCVAGNTTRDVDAAAAKAIADAGATPNFLGYYGYPATVCISVNDTVVHGIPDDYVLADGDLVSIDGGAIVDGWHGDSAFTMIVGGPQHADPADQRLSDATEAAMWAGIAAFATARRVGDIGNAIDAYATENVPDLGLVEEFTGHGIGTAMHMEPEVLNFAASNQGPRVKTGMVLCVEPMLTAGGIETVTLEDDWTVKTVDGKRASHWENTVARHAGGIWVLTEEDGGLAGLAPYGITPVPL
ncbi:type I methionyl aminopeptidase [Brevibacterium sp. 50QC2O2]|uniref:type I methionyl aminopeptidase n=1 Tax=Brevibacterium TaxID=1696 RepID=UPI00211C0E60|nr:MULTISPECIES: type I methionyl aminopeptidase [unclassified Brevibacterium]MCQ9385826.1 type I methionyl aminopeptidase [Brevibacterium sp. 68QC2CO]MCQ9389405.1 type I methionyl aminopeptidase [Brevibacterium sp. 50QC2O2]